MAAQPDEADKIKLTYASDITKQVLTLATAILTFTVTFRNDVVGETLGADNKWLYMSWVALGITIVAGLATLSALTAQVSYFSGAAGAPAAAVNITTKPVSWSAIVEFLAFVVALVSLAAFGVAALAGDGPDPTKTGSCTIEAPAHGECTVPGDRFIPPTSRRPDPGRRRARCRSRYGRRSRARRGRRP